MQPIHDTQRFLFPMTHDASFARNDSSLENNRFYYFVAMIYCNQYPPKYAPHFVLEKTVFALLSYNTVYVLIQLLYHSLPSE